MTSKMPLPGELDPIETASRDEISALQLERLKWSVRHTYDNVEPYRQKCQAKGVHPDDLKCLADLGKFPFMTKTDLRDHYPFGLFAVPRTKLARLHASSGTTGKSVVVGYTQNDINNWASVVARSIRAAGGRAGDMVHVAYGYGMFTGGLGAHYGVERAGCCAVPMSGGQTEKQVQQIMDFKPEIIMVTPSYSLVIAVAKRARQIAQKAEDERKRLSEASSNLNEFMQTMQRNLKFTVDEASGESVIAVHDAKTDELIRQIPSKTTPRPSKSSEKYSAPTHR